MTTPSDWLHAVHCGLHVRSWFAATASIIMTCCLDFLKCWYGYCWTGTFATCVDLIHAFGVQDMYRVHRFNFRDLDEDSGWMHAIAMEVSFWINLNGQPFTKNCT
jgi:hypothetical protein